MDSPYNTHVGDKSAENYDSNPFKEREPPKVFGVAYCMRLVQDKGRRRAVLTAVVTSYSIKGGYYLN
jgi:hypothetical protein